MTILDLILVLILFFFAFAGFFFGLISTLGSLVGTVAGVIIAGKYFGEFAIQLPIGNENLAKVVSFLIIFVVASKVIGLVFLLLDKIFKILSFIPLLKSLNRLAGLVLGLAEGAVVLGVTLVFIMRFPFADFLFPAIESSEVAGWLIHVGNILVPLLPDVVMQAKSIIK